MNRSIRSTAGEELNMIVVNVSVMIVKVGHGGGSACLNPNSLKFWSLAVERVASY